MSHCLDGEAEKSISQQLVTSCDTYRKWTQMRTVNIQMPCGYLCKRLFEAAWAILGSFSGRRSPERKTLTTMCLSIYAFKAPMQAVYLMRALQSSAFKSLYAGSAGQGTHTLQGRELLLRNLTQRRTCRGRHNWWASVWFHGVFSFLAQDKQPRGDFPFAILGKFSKFVYYLMYCKASG